MKQGKKRRGGGNFVFAPVNIIYEDLFECIHSSNSSNPEPIGGKRKEKLDEQPPQKRPEVIISEKAIHETKLNIYSICYILGDTTA